MLELDSLRLTDSSGIVPALDEVSSEPSLLPPGERERRRALELEDFFDERCAHDLRRVTLDPMLSRPELVRRYFLAGQPWLLRASAPVAVPLSAPMIRRRYDISEASLSAARAAVVCAFERLEAELGHGDYLVGDRFSVADLTAASLLSHLVLPPEYPYPIWRAVDLPKPLAAFREALSSRVGFLVGARDVPPSS